MDKELHKDYQKAGFGNSVLAEGRTALLVIDMARAYFESSSPLCLDGQQVLAGTRTLLALARSKGLPVFHTRVEYDKNGVNGGLFFKKISALKVFCAGSPLGEFADGVEPIDGEHVVVKQYASAFFATSLASSLRVLGVGNLLIAGVSTSGCVRASAVDAIQHGFMPVVVREAVGDRHSAPHEANLFDLQSKYAEVVNMDAVKALLEVNR